MSRLANVVAIEVDPVQRDHVVRVLSAHRARCLRDEPGTLQFEVLVPKDDAGKIHVYELYRDTEAFEAHRSGSSLVQLRDDVAGGLLKKVQGVQCTVVD